MSWQLEQDRFFARSRARTPLARLAQASRGLRRTNFSPGILTDPELPVAVAQSIDAIHRHNVVASLNDEPTAPAPLTALQRSFVPTIEIGSHGHIVMEPSPVEAAVVPYNPPRADPSPHDEPIDVTVLMDVEETPGAKLYRLGMARRQREADERAAEAVRRKQVSVARQAAKARSQPRSRAGVKSTPRFSKQVRDQISAAMRAHRQSAFIDNRGYIIELPEKEPSGRGKYIGLSHEAYNE